MERAACRGGAVIAFVSDEMRRRWSRLALGLIVLATAVAWMVSRAFWKRGLRAYTGASA